MHIAFFSIFKDTQSEIKTCGVRMLWCRSLLFLLILVGGPVLLNCKENRDSTATNLFPGEKWTTATPESQGVDSAKLQQAIDYFDANSEGVGADEMLVIRNGYVIWSGKSTGNQHEIFSGTKIFTTTILGLMLHDGLISGVDAKVAEFFSPFNDHHSEYKDVTFRQLATMTSGYDSINGSCWQRYKKGAFNEHDACVRTYTIPGAAMSQPGTVFNYHDPPVHMLGYIMTKIAGKALEDIFSERVANPIGMQSFTWSDYGAVEGLGGVKFNNPAGTPGIGQGGVITTPEDVARLGLVYLNRGRWDGRQILSEEWVQEATKNQVPNSMEAKNDHRGRFGYMWHTNGVPIDGVRRWPSAPPNTYTFFGYSRNYCFVIPEWNMVIVRMSPYEAGGMNNPSSVWETFFSTLKNGIH
jgi:CubicO group peptidase (beta-lactamase class C family)